MSEEERDRGECTSVGEVFRLVLNPVLATINDILRDEGYELPLCPHDGALLLIKGGELVCPLCGQSYATLRPPKIVEAARVTKPATPEPKTGREPRQEGEKAGGRIEVPRTGREVLDDLISEIVTKWESRGVSGKYHVIVFDPPFEMDNEGRMPRPLAWLAKKLKGRKDGHGGRWSFIEVNGKIYGLILPLDWYEDESVRKKVDWAIEAARKPR